MRLSGIGKWAAAGMLALAMMTAPQLAQAQSGGTVLTRMEAAKLLPATVFYRGRVATTQLRNSGGVKFTDGYYVLATLVDTSGYSTGLQAKYQAYFIVEVPIKVGGENLAAGIYGIGFIGDKFLVTDVGAHDVLSVKTGDDEGLKRPTPLQVLPGPEGGFRLYEGRRYVSFSR